MKSTTAFIIMTCLFFTVHLKTAGQSNKVPPFRIVQTNGKVFKAENLPYGKPIIIIYFSPECEDCQLFTTDLIGRINDFGKASIAMITYLSVESVSGFIKKNNLNKYSNIYIGTEGNYLFVKNYYNIEQFPFVALFNKNGDLIKKYYSKEINLNDLSQNLKKLL